MTEARAVPEQRWAVLRLVLGTTQIVGATMAAAFLYATGPSSLTLGATVGTLAFTLLSYYLFQVRLVQHRHSSGDKS